MINSPDIKNFSLSYQFLDKLQKNNQATSSRLEIQLIGAAALPFVQAIDAFVHLALASAKLVISLGTAFPYVITLLVSKPSPLLKEWSLPSTLPFVVIHLARVVENLFSAVILPFLYLINPSYVEQIKCWTCSALISEEVKLLKQTLAIQSGLNLQQANQEAKKQTQLKEEIEKLKEEILNKEKTSQENTNQIDDLNKQIKALEESKKEAKSLLEKAQIELTAVTKEKDENQKQIHGIGSQLKTQTTEIENLKQQIKAREKENQEALQFAADEKSVEQEVHQQQINSLNTSLEEKEKICQELKKQLKNKNKEGEDLKQIIDRARDESNEAKTKIASLIDEFQRKLENQQEIEKQVNNTTDELARLKEEQTQLQKEIEVLDRRKQEIIEFNKKEQPIGEEASLEKLEHERKLETAHTKDQAEIIKQSLQIAELNIQFIELNKQIEGLQQEKANLKRKCDEATKIITKIVQEKTDYYKQLDEAQQKEQAELIRANTALASQANIEATLSGKKLDLLLSFTAEPTCVANGKVKSVWKIKDDQENVYYTAFNNQNNHINELKEEFQTAKKIASKLREKGESYLAVEMEELENKDQIKINNNPTYTLKVKKAEGDLESFLNNPSINFNQRIEYTWQVLKGISNLHQAGYLHGDLKPENILIYEKEGKKILRLADFGKALEIKKGIKLSMQGNPRFSPPEFLTTVEGEVYGSALIAIRMLEEACFEASENSLIKIDKRKNSATVVKSNKTIERRGIEKYVVEHPECRQFNQWISKNGFVNFTLGRFFSYHTEAAVYEYIDELTKQLVVKELVSQEKAVNLNQLLKDMTKDQPESRIKLEEAIEAFEKIFSTELTQES